MAGLVRSKIRHLTLSLSPIEAEREKNGMAAWFFDN